MYLAHQIYPIMKINIPSVLKELGLEANEKGDSTGSHWSDSGASIHSYSPVDGKQIGAVSGASLEDYDMTLNKATEAFETFRKIPAPKRGELVRQF